MKNLSELQSWIKKAIEFFECDSSDVFIRFERGKVVAFFGDEELILEEGE